MSEATFDACLVLATGALGVYFVALGVRAWIRERPAPQTREAAAEREGWEAGLPVRPDPSADDPDAVEQMDRAW